MMTEYTSKGFRVCYDIKPTESNLYHAEGEVFFYTKDSSNPCLLQKFHTEHPTKIGAKTEIKRLIDDYINFEWKKHLEMKKN
ncbi:hypothetical protein [Legionella sp. 29fVS95]|uniref:hypothetical protein n=2 Tax=Legionella TaxID=445 RepID=UPI003AF511F7